MKNILVIICLTFLSINYTFAQEELKIASKHLKQADVYIDGNKYDHLVLEIIDQNKVASVDVLKGDKAIEKYNAPNGVILVTTKLSKERIVYMDNESIKIKKNKNPKVILNGKTSNKAAISKLKSDEVESIQVIKGEEALKKYNASSAVIVTTTK